MSVVTPEFDAALAAAEAALDAGVGSVERGREAVDVLQAAERLTRLAAVARVDAIAEVHASRAFLPHGHASAHAMARHLGRVSSADTARADKIRRMIAGCDAIDSAWRAGKMSVDQAGVLARAFSNPRVRVHFAESQSWFLGLLALPYPAFEKRVAAWVRLADADGSEPQPDPGHQQRDFSLVQDHFSLQFTARGSFGAMQGAEIGRVFDAYLSAETLHDWDIAREQHGDDTCAAHLPRTVAQRRADALAQIFADALHNPNRSVPVETVHNIVWSEQSLEAMMRRWFGDEPAPIEVDDHRCHTLDGHPLHEDAAFADFLVSPWRKVVQDVKGKSLDISAKQRFYVGLARLGIVISHDTCFWPGCNVAATRCEIDHRKPAARGGLTTQDNGRPACTKHNRLKERGYTVTLLDDGVTIEIRTPDGEIIP